MLSVGIYVKYHTVQLVPEAAAKDTVNELRPDANAPIESAPSESGGEAQQVLNPTNEAMSAQADPAAAAAEMESQVNAVDGVAQNETFASLAGVQPLADAESQVDQEAGSSQLDQTGAVLPGDVNPGAAVESSPLETPDASLEVQNAQQPEDNPQEPTDSVPAPEKEQHPAPEPAPKKKDDGKQNANAKKQSDGKDKKSDDKNKKEASKTDKSVDKNKKDSSKQTKDEGKGKKDGKGKQDLPKSSKDNKDHKNDKQPDVTMLMSRAERHEMAEARRKANAKRRAKMHKRRSGGDRRR
eukprot:CAMPEP_0114259666 /NCGR_PEP_ID=MMETSP0058-20121206/20019_1 /TAXON_ID=36894 /ORGANISM="Pyramimonas parkeae, CCMP726" /LENGTH=296 /DNA_ID=CAMNT_0001374737 /DNA_START=237 /DNA_END=1127 /DNA_ORIENTATION=-